VFISKIHIISRQLQLFMCLHRYTIQSDERATSRTTVNNYVTVKTLYRPNFVNSYNCKSVVFCSKLCHCDIVVPGGWSGWSLWSSCSRSCGGGSQVRRRTCKSPVDCFSADGEGYGSMQNRSCNTQACPGMSSRCFILERFTAPYLYTMCAQSSQRGRIACNAERCNTYSNSVFPTVCPSVTRWYPIQTNEERIM